MLQEGRGTVFYLIGCEDDVPDVIFTQPDFHRLSIKMIETGNTIDTNRSAQGYHYLYFRIHSSSFMRVKNMNFTFSDELRDEKVTHQYVFIGD
jgi:hypothetical protein